ncbi:hypothetical protein [Dapis sp. BLCC M172]|uniref:hypothetical protein n=1 Tax=Dapis sp. BLCC M172 TaxID=2975281 RepID=UPI003CFB9D44
MTIAYVGIVVSFSEAPASEVRGKFLTIADGEIEVSFPEALEGKLLRLLFTYIYRCSSHKGIKNINPFLNAIHSTTYLRFLSEKPS